MLAKLKQHPSILNAQKQYDMLSSRDRTALKFMIVAIVLCILYFAMWVPAQSFMADAQRDLDRNKELLELVNENKALLRAMSRSSGAASTPTLNSQQLVSSVTNLAKKKGLSLKRFEPSGENKLKVWMDEQSFDKMVSWLAELKRTLNVRVEQVSIEKEDKEGLISARLTLAS